MSEELSRKSRLIKSIVAEFNSNPRFTSAFTPGAAGTKDEMDIQFNYPPHLKAERIELENFVMEKLTWDQSVKPIEDPSDFVVLHFHGGGYVSAMKRHYKMLAGLYSEVGRGATVVTVDYRVAPEHTFPAAFDDAVAAYEWLLGEGYKGSQIVLAGDSAGGGLAMALTHYIKSTYLPIPAGIVAMSPWTDVTASGPSYTTNFDIDPVFGNDRSELIMNNPYVGDADPKDPRISPLFGDFTGFPPMLIQVGTDEMLLSDSEEVAAKAKSAGVRVRFTKYEGMFHVFQLTGTMMEESRHAWAEVKRFFEEI